MAGWWRCWVVLPLILLSSPATPQPAAPTPNPSLQAAVGGIDDAAHRRDLSLHRFDVSVELRGAVAETVIEAAFANPSSQNLEGDFRLTLPAGAIVTGYALDIDGKMVDGVLVDRPRAKALYQERVRQRVDPGLAEVTPDNQFRTRVFPIMPGRGRTIRLRFVAPVPPREGLRLPIAIDAPQRGWSVTVHATGTEAAPLISLPGRRPAAMTATTDGFELKSRGDRTPLSGVLVVAPAASPDVLVSRHANGERYLQLSAALPAAAARAQPQRVRIYWDRSRSRLGNRLGDEIALLGRYIERLRAASVELVAFNSSGADRRIVKDAAEAASWLKTLQYRGATSFAAIASDPPADVCLLFSDGRVTIDRAIRFSPRCRLDAVSSAADADIAWLRHLTGSHGGQVLALGRDDAGVLTALTAALPSVVAVVDRDGRPLPFVPLDTAPGRWLITARAPEAGGVTVRLGGAGAAGEVTAAVVGEGTPFDGEAALIASDGLAILGATEQRGDFVALSRRYGIASPSLSFLVLETPADYITADLAPPTNYPAALRADFVQLRRQAKTERDEEERERFDELLGDWKEQVDWWKKKFDPAARPKSMSTARASSDQRVIAGAPSPGMLPPPPPPPPPMSMPAPPAAVMEPSASVQDIQVTAQRRSERLPSVPMTITAVRGESRARDNANDIIVTGARRWPRRSEESGGVVEIDAWSPERPYLELYDGAPAQFDARFLEAEARRGSIPAFYFDTAEWLRKHGRKAEAIEMLLSALELPAANEVTFGIVAAKLERYGAFDRAVELRERHAALDPKRPQPKRLLALALARRAAAQPAGARADFDRAIRLLGEVALTVTDDDGNAWEGIDLVALTEANALVPRLRALGGKPALDPRLIALLDVDVRIVVDWTSDATDLDLWVDEPNGEKAIYSNPRTAIGGHLSDDMTDGYGPEEYLLRYAPAGTYTVQANVFASDPLDPNGASIVTAHLIRDFGRSTEREDSVDIELTPKDDGEKTIGRIVVPPRKSRPR